MKLITAEQAAVHPARSQLTRSLGLDPLVNVDVYREAMRIGDTFILCSDGLWDVVGRNDLVRIVEGDGPPGSVGAHRLSDVAARLVRTAIERDATDNVTAVVVHVTSDRPVPPEMRRSLFRRRG